MIRKVMISSIQNKSDKAEIDNILLNDIGKQIVKFMSVEGNTALNISDHHPVEEVIDIAAATEENPKTKLMCKSKWKKCNKTVR